MQNHRILAGAGANSAPSSRMSDHERAELIRKQQRQEQQRRALDRASAGQKRRAKAELAAARKSVKLEADKVKLLQQQMTERMDRAKMEAHSIASTFHESVKAYVESNAMRPERIGWVQDLMTRAHVLPRGLTTKFVKNPTQAKLRGALRRTLLHPSNRAWSTKKFGAAAHTVAFFEGDPGVALGFSIGREPQTYDTSEHIGIDFGPDFVYTTSTEASDGVISSEAIRLTLFRRMDLARFRVDTTKIISSAMQSALRDLNASQGEHIEWLVPLECWGKRNITGGVGDAENGHASGLYFGVYKHMDADSQQQSTRVIVGYWGLVGMRLPEISAAAYDAFNVDEANADDLGSSCLMNLVRSGDPMLEHREFSLRSQGNTEEQKALLVKNSLGYFIVAEPIDRRKEIPYFNIAGTLPLELTEDYVGNLDLLHRYGGRIVFTDFQQKMIHYYTSGGNLRVRMFNDAAPLNDYDYVDLHTRKFVLEKSNVNTAVEAAQSRMESGKGYEVEGVNLEHLRSWNSLQNDTGMPDVLATTAEAVPSEFEVTVEMLRKSFNGNRILYNIVQSYFCVFAAEKAVDLVKGYTFVGETDDDDLAALANRMVLPQMKVMMHVATLSELDFPTMETAKAAVAKHQDQLQNPDLTLTSTALGKYLDEHGVAQHFKLQPHQCRAFGMSAAADTGVGDVDMGGGKTLLSLLLFTNWIEKVRAAGGKPRALIVMPDQLVPNYYREVKKFTRRDPANQGAGSKMNVVTLRSKNSRMSKVFTENEIMDKLAEAPDNTIIIVSYSWISAGYVKINTGEYRTTPTGERAYKYEYLFPRAEALCQRAGVNMVILDESHKIKNNGEGRGFAHKACMALSRVKNKFLMTGTFISKNPQDMFNQVKFINPTLLGSVADFRKRYTTENGQWNHDTLKDLRRYIAARGVITMRREEWLYQLPQKTERFHFADFREATPKLFEIYKTLWEATNKEFPAEFAEMLGGGKVKVDSESDDSDSASDALDQAADEIAEEKALRALNGSEYIDASRDTADQIVKSPVGARLQALRALVSAPERFPVFDESLRKVQSLLNFDHETLLKGPKDELVIKLCREHFEETLGNYVPPSKQEGPEEKKVGKIAIVSDRILIAKHFQRVLEEAGFKNVGYYDASNRNNLEAFCDPEDTSVSIMCMVENSVREGFNGQSISRLIKVTVPWTTGEYDQLVARAFRIGQRKNVIVDNVLCTRSFEPAQLARMISRENVNKKVSSDFDSAEWMEEITINPDIANPESGLIGEHDLRHYSYGLEDNKREVDLLELHENIYRYELRKSVAWKYAYLYSLVDTPEAQAADPESRVYRNLDRRQEIKDSVVGTGHPFGCPAEVYYSENRDLENKLVFVDGDRNIGIMYTRSQKQPSRLEYLRIQFYQLNRWNHRADDGDIANCHETYEPWPTHGIDESEMAVPAVDAASVVEIEEKVERELAGIGSVGLESRLRARIVRELRAASDSQIDVHLTRFLEGKPLNPDSKLVNALYAAIWEGVFEPLVIKSVGMYTVYSKITKTKFARNDSQSVLAIGIAAAAERMRDRERARILAKTTAVVSDKINHDEVLPGPVTRGLRDDVGYSAGFGEIDGKYALVIPRHKSNIDAGAPAGMRGWSTRPERMFAVVSSEAQVRSLFQGITRAGLVVRNPQLLQSPAFKHTLAKATGVNMPDQTSTLSIMSSLAVATSYEVELEYMVVEKHMLVLASGDKSALTSIGFKPMPAYLFKFVDANNVASALEDLENVRYKTALASRVYTYLRVRAQVR